MDEGTQGQTTQTEVAPAQRHIIQRPRLYRLLDESNARIILLVAPAGYGKTTLARQWTSRRGRRSYWCELGLGSADPVVLARAIATALEESRPGLTSRLDGYLLGATAPDTEPEVLAEVLAESLRDWPSSDWLVLDAYEAVQSGGVADAFIARLLDRPQIRALIATRHVPAWIPARRILYGEVSEVTREVLAMTKDEAEAVLERPERNPARMIELARGWPALLALAALVADPIHAVSDQPETLHAFFATELLESVPGPTRSLLPLLAVSPELDWDTLRVLFGPQTEVVIREAERVGFAIRTPTGLDVHPLVRSFLRQKLSAATPPPDLIAQLTAHLIAKEAWDGAFDLISRYRQLDEFAALLNAALPVIGGMGRTATLQVWARWADDHGVELPEVSLARAELLLRRGDATAAEHLATAAANALSYPRLAAEAWICAGTAAHLQDEYERALDHYTRALQTTPPSNVRRRALWGSFLARVHEPEIDWANLVHPLEALADASPEHLLRLAQARLLASEYQGGIDFAADEGLRHEPLCSEVTDPKIRTGFLNLLSDALVASARYAEGERVARRELQEAREAHLGFVIPHALLNLATARLGEGDFAEARGFVEEALRATPSPDPFVVANALGISARIDLSRGLASGDLTQLDVPVNARSEIAAEARASHALACAVAGEAELAEALLRDAPAAPKYVLAQALEAAVALVAKGGSEDATEAGICEFATSIKTSGCYDVVTCLARAHRSTLKALVRSDQGRQIVEIAYARSGDPVIRSALGVRPTRSDLRQPRLSPRETEVVVLVAQGLRNDEIADRLFISPKTVKTHLQHIYEKLGARSRTEAAAMARSVGLL